jgi:hypothetical protein
MRCRLDSPIQYKGDWNTENPIATLGPIMATLPPMTSVSAYYIEYFKIIVKVRLVRLVADTLGRMRSKPTSDLRPSESILVPSTKSNRRIRVNAYRTKAAMGHDVGPVAVHLNWHGPLFP